MIIRSALSSIKRFVIVQLARLHHKHLINRIRRKVERGQKIRVLFLDTETSKWKVQSLFSAMLNDLHYEPIVGISRRDNDRDKGIEEIKNGITRACEFHKRNGNPTVLVYDADENIPLDLCSFKPDIIFYQQQWNTPGYHNIISLYKKVITCYIPYGLPSYGFLNINAQMLFYRLLTFYFVLNDAWVREYLGNMPPMYYSGRLLGLGHTMLDEIGFNPDNYSKKMIIYAPHFSIEEYKPILNLSTFMQNGRQILAYAKKHRDWHWIFRPHPVLKKALLVSNVWSESEINEYYSEWAKIGQVSVSGGYAPLFKDASVMVTDCGSFLTEFGATGKPIIHLISQRNNYIAAEPFSDMLASFYEVKSLKDMYECFRIVLEEGKDPKREKRLRAVKKANLAGQNAAKNIMDFFAKEFHITD